MEKLCPKCGTKNKSVASFCSKCGADIKQPTSAAMPNRIQPAPDVNAGAMNTNVQGTNRALNGISFTYYVPALTSIIGILFALAGKWIKLESYYDRESFTFFELLEVVAEEADFLAIIVGGVMMLFLLLLLAGAILVGFKKTAGKVLFIIGTVLSLLATLAVVAVFVIMDIEYNDVRVSVLEGPIAFIILSVVGIVFAAMSKTGKKLSRSINTYPPVAYPPTPAQQNVYANNSRNI